MAKISEASIKDIEVARKLIDEAKLKTAETKALCDLITAQPVSDDLSLRNFNFHDWEKQKKKIQKSKVFTIASEILHPLSAMHFPIAFPEIFLGRYKGFNVIIGNPPWEEVKPEERDFWTSEFPGIRSLKQKEQLEKWEMLSKNRMI